MSVTKTELRVTALTLAINTPGQPNRLAQAREYLEFLTEDLAEPAPLTETYHEPRSPSGIGHRPAPTTPSQKKAK